LCVFAAGPVYSKTVDIYNANTGALTAAALKTIRSALSATSLPNLGVAMFAGGYGELFVCIGNNVYGMIMDIEI
jgi:hypothetical protein